MGLEDTVYKEGTVHSRKDLGDVNLNSSAMEMLIQNEVHKGSNPEYVFKDCSDEGIKAIIEYLDYELAKEAPLGDASDEISRRIRAYREGLVEILMK
jgi:hypothetical protein